MRPSIFLALALFSSSLAAAEIVSSELPVSTKVYEGSYAAWPRTAVGATKSYSAWSQFPEVYGAELTANGHPALETKAHLATVTSFTGVFAAGDLFYLAAADKDGDYVRRIDNGATARGLYRSFAYNGSRILLAGTQTELRDTGLNLVVPQVGASANVWTAAGGKFFGLVNDPAGARLISVDNDGHVQTLTSSATPAFSATLAGNGAELLHVWMQADKLLLHAQRYSLNGTALSGMFDVGPSPINPIARFDVASAGSDFFVSWSEDLGTNLPMYYRRVSGSSAAAPVLIDHAFRYESWQTESVPVMTGGAAGVFMSWISPVAKIRRLDVASDTQPLYLSLPDQQNLKVASDGVVALAGWSESGFVRVGRIDPGGALLDGAGIVVAPDLAPQQILAALLFDGVNYFVLIHELEFNVQDALYARIVHRDGTFATGLIPVTTPGQQIGQPTAFWTGSAYRVMWVDQQFPGSGKPYKIVAVDVMTNGVASAPVATALSTFSPDDSFSILWSARPLYVEANGYTARFLDDLSTITIPNDPTKTGGVTTGPAVTNGTNILIPWTTFSPLTASPFGANFWIARWDLKGKVLDFPWLVGSTASSISIGLGSRTTPRGLAVLPDGAGYKLAIGGDTIKVARIDDRAFACRCLDDVTDLGTSGAVLASAAAVGTDVTAIAYLHPVSDPGTSSAYRAFIRFTRVGPPPKRRAAGR